MSTEDGTSSFAGIAAPQWLQVFQPRKPNEAVEAAIYVYARRVRQYLSPQVCILRRVSQLRSPLVYFPQTSVYHTMQPI